MNQRVLIDVNSLLKPQLSGVGVYTGELIRHLCSSGSSGPQWGFYYNRNRRADTRHLALRLPPERVQDGFDHGLGYRSGIDQEFGRFIAPWVDLQTWTGLSSRKWRIFHATNMTLPALPPGVKGIVTVHDLLFSRFPQFTSHYMRRRWSKRLGQALGRADCVIAISETTARDLSEYYHVDSKKIRLIYQGVDDSEIEWITAEDKTRLRRQWNLPEKFLLFVSTLSVHKNVLALIKAFSQIDQPDLGLVIVGKPGDASAEIQAALETCPRRDAIRILGYLEPADLEAFYQLATAFVFPSLHEGFGLPVLEAMKRRLAVVTSNDSALGELFHDSAILVNPRDPDDIARGIQGLLQDESTRSALIEKGERQARMLSWRKTAEQTLKLYESYL